MKFPLLVFLSLFTSLLSAQTNIITTNSTAEQILIGNYNPTDYLGSSPITSKSTIIQGLNSGVNADSLKSYILKLASFKNRNTGSDTLSLTRGIGAARNWVLDQFNAISFSNENRLITSFLQFDQIVCNIGRHKNIMAVLPGTDPSNNEVILVEGHIDSRTIGVCDTASIAEGVEDNASGTALVIELARVLSRYTFKNTIVFMATIGEEQGLIGAEAFATYVKDKNIPLVAVLNNDVIGGVICGKTSSEPSCPGENEVDSTQVRLFSNGNFNSASKQLARYIKLQYKEELLPIVDVPMAVTIMSGEDRIGRGGDHIPFREKGYAAMRFTSANEHGNAASSSTAYTDRQHSSDDIIGIDTNNDSSIDEYFVDFNYLARNTVINGVSAASIAFGPESPTVVASLVDTNRLAIEIVSDKDYEKYRLALRTLTHDWDSVYTFNQKFDTITVRTDFALPNGFTFYFLSAANVDSLNTESLFSEEIAIQSIVGITEFDTQPQSLYTLLQNKPNPFDEITTISVASKPGLSAKKGLIKIFDLEGKLVETLPIDLSKEINEVSYAHGYGTVGTYLYSLEIDGQIVSSKRMIFAN